MLSTLHCYSSLVEYTTIFIICCWKIPCCKIKYYVLCFQVLDLVKLTIINSHLIPIYLLCTFGSDPYIQKVCTGIFTPAIYKILFKQYLKWQKNCNAMWPFFLLEAVFYYANLHLCTRILSGLTKVLFLSCVDGCCPVLRHSIRSKQTV